MLAEPALEREFVYGGDERKRHAIALVTSTLTVLWASDDFDFQPSRAFYDVVRASFSARVAGAGNEAEQPQSPQPRTDAGSAASA